MRKTNTTKAAYLAFAMIVAFLMILSGCQSTNNEVASIYLHLEKAAKMESSLGNQQKELAGLLKKEQEIYTNMLSVSINSKQMDDMLTNATDLIKKREEILEKEKASYQQAYKEVSKINRFIPKLDDKKLQQKVEKVAEAMNNRYKTYKKIFHATEENIKSNQAIYTLLLQKNVHIKKYEKQIKIMNKQSKEITDLQTKFNHYTNIYNDEKINLYKAGKLNWKS
ncbi:hypothetical protein J6TS2_07820 [Heyndrickxia sporothermodurans]|nr:hypothetical protein J6TS2_07820 [Heyndrickxia sporothermodurans]